LTIQDISSIYGALLFIFSTQYQPENAMTQELNRFDSMNLDGAKYQARGFGNADNRYAAGLVVQHCRTKGGWPGFTRNELGETTDIPASEIWLFGLVEQGYLLQQGLNYMPSARFIDEAFRVFAPTQQAA
jgi:hypothetical protein